MDFDFTEIGAIAAAGLASIVAAYQDFSNASGGKKFLMLLGPIVLLGLVLAVVG